MSGGRKPISDQEWMDLRPPRSFVFDIPYTDADRAIASHIGVRFSYDNVGLEDTNDLVEQLEGMGVFTAFLEVGGVVEIIQHCDNLDSITFQSKMVGRLEHGIWGSDEDGRTIMGYCAHRRIMMTGEAPGRNSTIPFRAATTLRVVRNEDGIICLTYGRGCIETTAPMIMTLPEGTISAADRSLVGGNLIGLALAKAWINYGCVLETTTGMFESIPVIDM